MPASVLPDAARLSTVERILWAIQVAAVAIAALVHVFSHRLAAPGNVLVGDHLTYLATVGTLVYAGYLWGNWVTARRFRGALPGTCAGALIAAAVQGWLSFDLFRRARFMSDIAFAHALVWVPFFAVVAGIGASVVLTLSLRLIVRRRKN